MNKKKLVLAGLIAASITAADVVGQSKTSASNTQSNAKSVKPLVTFVELGSVRCIPCRQMQPVMKAIEQKYGDQVKVLFHDVWKSDQYEYAEKYEIRLIPTQVFLDEDGKEFFRHEGFFPEAEIHRVLQKRGLKVRSEG